MRAFDRSPASRLLAFCLVTCAGTAIAADRLSVDLGQDTGPFHGGASGSLYGLYDARLPFPNLVEGIGLRSVATKAQDGLQHPGADALEVIRSIATGSGGDTYIYMTDIHRGFPYRWTQGDCARSVARYLDEIARQVEQIKALPAQYRQHVVFVPFNEPEGNMFAKAAAPGQAGPDSCNGADWRSDPSAYFDAWDRAWRRIRAILPDARIAGPNTSILYDQNKGFLQHALRAGTLPDVVTWHELSNPASLTRSVARFRGWEQELFAGTALAGRHLPINIDEYAFNYHTSVPGQIVQWAAAIEAAKVDADLAYWNIDGNLSDSAVQANRGNGQWWLLNAYAAMRGMRTVAVTPPHPGQDDSLQAVAAFDPQQLQARVLFGGGSGPATLSLIHIPHAGFGAQARVVVREIPWTGQLGDAAAPRLVADVQVPVVADRIDLQFGHGALPALAAESAYSLVVMPGMHGGPAQPPALRWQRQYEAEDAAHHGSGYERRGPEGSPQALDRFFTSGRYAVGGFASDRDVRLDFPIEVPQDGVYDLRILANSFNQDPLVAALGPTNVFVRLDGDAASEREVMLPLGYKPVVWDHADLRIALRAGRHVLSIASASADGRRHTRGNALIDRIGLSLPDPASDTQVYEAELAALAGGAQARYDRDDVSGAGAVALPAGATATFWVYAPQAGMTPLSLDLATPGALSLAVNGHPLQAPAQRVFLMGGINKIVVGGSAERPLLDRLRVGPGAVLGPRYEAEQATLAGTAHRTKATLASGGEAVTGIGGEPGNGNTLTFASVTVERTGPYMLTLRYANDEQSKASHYNPDPLARIGRIRVNGAPPILASFPHSFHRNNWWELSVPVELHAGRNRIQISGEEVPDADGIHYISQRAPDILLRSRDAPDIDWIAVTPLQDDTAALAPR
ncbi:cellulosome protein [Xanthomonas sp. A2111]|uniref:Cellulosome protein n=1 Tax=Xanthomonas hawaiiensis TaxID=3003247 RepID=A0ABU2I7X3_9XANT|nr:cellulosome protein [Xanthomonas sp. A2111]MBO9827669.1 cellulosome protein [Xanthomonas sp. A2111]MDS9994241.1 cellulosome protein [Xanthomonas sp. A2111]